MTKGETALATPPRGTAGGVRAPFLIWLHLPFPFASARACGGRTCGDGAVLTCALHVRCSAARLITAKMEGVPAHGARQVKFVGETGAGAQLWMID